MDTENKVQQSATVPDIIERRRLRRERKAARRKAKADSMTPAEALASARAAALKREMELEKGDKVSRRERSAMFKAMKAGVDASAAVGQRVRSLDSVPAAMLETAKQVEFALITELVDAVRQNPQGALQVARLVNVDAVAAVEKKIMEIENQSAAVATVATGATLDAAVGRNTVEEPIGGANLVPVADSATVAVKMGRPSTFTEQEGDAICEWLQSGRSLNRYCIEHGRQAATVYQWLRERPDFANNYNRAHMDRADTFVEDMVDISDKAEKASNMVELLAYKLQIETRQWISQRMRPEKYGTKVQVEQKGNVTIQMGMPKRKTDVIDVTPSTPSLHDAKQ